MECSCIRQTQLPGTTKLFGDYLYRFGAVREFYGRDFSDPEAVTSAAKAIRFPDERREAIARALREQNGDCATVRKLAEPGTVAVVTGQQVGLFSGPAYTIFKALTAVKLAEHLNEQGIPAVPIFWLATEDHDLAEVDHVWVFNEHATPAKLSIESAVANGGPVGGIVPAETPLAELRAALGELPFAEEVATKIAAAYGPGVALGSAFRSLLQDVLKGCGLVYLDPLAPAVREIAAGFLAEAAERAPELVSALRERDHALTAAGYHTQVHIDDDTSLLFLIGEHRRIPLRWKDGQFVARDHSYNAREMRDQAERLSPNALLRPVMQDYLLPTAAYIGGPAETAYMAQSQVLYEKLLGRMPVIFPRNSFTLLDARATKLLERFELCVPQILDHEEKVKSAIAGRLVPPSLSEAVAARRSEIAGSLEELQASLRAFDPTLESATKKSTSKMMYQVEKLSQKTAREIMRRDERASQDATYLMNLIYPHGHLQERIYSIVPFLAKHGLDLPKRLLAQTQLACPDHMVRTL
jgi:bacillithiol synthase